MCKTKRGRISRTVEDRVTIECQQEVIRLYAASIGTTTDDTEWWFHASRAISAVAELLVIELTGNVK